MHPYVHCSIIHGSQDMNEWIKKMWYREREYYYYYWAIKKEWNLAICDNMDGPGGHHESELSPIEKDKYHMISLICRI